MARVLLKQSLTMNGCIFTVGCGIALSAACADGSRPAGARRICDDNLKSLDLGRDTKVTLVRAFKQGDPLALVNPAPGTGVPARADLCLVKMTVGPGNPGPAGAPSTSAGIGIEVWLPAHANWNQRYRALGGGGWQGGPAFTSLTEIASLSPADDPDGPIGAAIDGFVVSATDAGHSIAGEGSFAMNPDGSLNEALLRDFAERAVHEMARETKAVITAYYGISPKYSYFTGCSSGGRQGLMEVQRHPEDFDGVLAGAPAVPMGVLAVADLWPQIVMQQDVGGPIAAAKLAAVTAAANAACDRALTGQPDGYISDPGACAYDPTLDASLLCVSDGGTNTKPCLTGAEATAVDKIWYGPTSDGTAPPPSTDNGFGAVGAPAPNQPWVHSWFGLSRGALLVDQPFWGGLAGPTPFTIATDHLALALGDASFAQPNFVNEQGNGQGRWRTLQYAGPGSFATAMSASRERFHDLADSDNPDITVFRDRGGKLLMWHGTADTLIPIQGSVRYYESVAARLGGYIEAQKVARLYLGPGLDHCVAAVPGTNPPVPGGRFGPGMALLKVLERWVEDGDEPGEIAAVSVPGATPTRARPWCPYPKALKYVGGDVNTGEFTCE